MVDSGVPVVEGESLPVIERGARDSAARIAIHRALERSGWNIKESSKLLGIPEKTLYDKCSRLGIKLRGGQMAR
jgi:transcriptional regulator of acetoin/glycerol metabolism